MADANGTCTVCDISGCASGSMLLKKIDSMISDNYTLLFVLGVMLIVVGLALTYFITSFVANIKGYLKSKEEVVKASSGGDNPREYQDDDHIYYENPKDDPQYEEPKEYMPVSQREYLNKVDKEYDEYNKLKTQYIASTYNGRKNDDIIDRNVLFKEYDNYGYDNTDTI